MAIKDKKEAQTPLILRAHRLMEAFAKSDDERDFYLDKTEGFILFVDLDKVEDEVTALERELVKNSDRYRLIPKLSFYETKKIMEGFVNEKVYDIDTKEKLLDIIQSKEARENFLEFIYDHHAELEKWQQFYQERSRIRIIEWLRQNHFHFVFEEDLDLSGKIIEQVKESLFEKTKVSKEVLAARKAIAIKAKTYYLSEALNPRPKRGRPPKQIQKTEVEPQISSDIYLTVPLEARPFLFTPDISTAADVTFSEKFESGEELIASIRSSSFEEEDEEEEEEEEKELDNGIGSLNKKLQDLRKLSSHWVDTETSAPPRPKVPKKTAEKPKTVPKPRAAKKRIIKEKLHKTRLKKTLPKKPTVKKNIAQPTTPSKKKTHLRRTKTRR